VKHNKFLRRYFVLVWSAMKKTEALIGGYLEERTETPTM
jgi:hypothetical protein